MALSLRAQNWLNSMDQELPAARAAEAGYLPVCPANDAASNEVLAELTRRGQRCAVVDGVLCAAAAPGRRNVYQRPVATLADEAADAVERWLASGQPMSARGAAVLAKVNQKAGVK